MKSICQFFVLTLVLTSFVNAQDSSPTPTPEPTPLARIDVLEEQKKLIEKETELLKAKREYLKEFAEAAGNDNTTRETSGGKIGFGTEADPIIETIDLSYDAVIEIADEIDRTIGPFKGNYDRYVLFYEPDFMALSRYRLYREEARRALLNYEELVKAVEAEAKRQDARRLQAESTDKMAASLVTALSMPEIAGSAVRSVAGLISLFRTDTTITQSKNIVDQKSLNAVVAGKLLKSGKVPIYNPEQFVPEYDLGISKENSFYQTVSRLRAAVGYVDYLEDAAKTAPPSTQSSPSFKRVLASIRIMKRQLDQLSFDIEPDLFPEKPEDKAALTEFRAMVRAERLDDFLTSGGRVGIVKLRLLSSGGSRRERRNLLLGSRTDYSGSAVVELSLYDLDGTLRISEIVKHHTGFRKVRVVKQSP